jgi:predicted nucleic acid-binding Zn ribbon protein
VDLTFWVIQGLLLTPVLFMAASLGMEDQPRRFSGGPVLAGLLSQFTSEQQARLVMLRAFVQESRRSRGALSDDLVAEPESADEVSEPRRRGRRHELIMAGALALIVIGLVGVVRTSIAMDDLQRATTSRVEPLSVSARFLPGMVVNPGKYLSAVNGGSSSLDPLYSVSLMEDKQAMDRWEALAAVGLAVLLFANALRDADGSIASDAAPFIVVAAVLLMGLSFFELP